MKNCKINRYIKLGLIAASFVYSLNIFAETKFESRINYIENNTVSAMTVRDTAGGVAAIIQARGGKDFKELKLSDKPISISGAAYDEKPFSSGDIIQLAPLSGKGFAWLPDEIQGAKATIVFQAKDISGDIQIGIDSQIGTDPEYKIIIGGHGNTRSSIIKNGIERAFVQVPKGQNVDNELIEAARLAMAGRLKTQETSSYTQYYVCYREGLILVGKGIPGENIFLSWRDPDPDKFVRWVGLGCNKDEINYTNIFLLKELTPAFPGQIDFTIKPIQATKAEEKTVAQNIGQKGTVVKLQCAGKSFDAVLVTKEDLPAGSIIKLKKAYQYVAINKSIVALKYGETVYLKNMKVTKEAASVEPIKTTFYLSAGANNIADISNELRGSCAWKLESSTGASGEIKFGSEVSLRSVSGYLTPSTEKERVTGPDAQKWLIIDPNNPANNGLVQIGDQIALQSTAKRTYIGVLNEDISFGTYATDDERWTLSSEKETAGATFFSAFANETNGSNFNTLFRIIRPDEGDWVGLQSVVFNENLEAGANANVGLGESDFYGGADAGKFLIYKTGDDFLVYSKVTGGFLNSSIESKPLVATKPSNLDWTKFKLEVISKPQIIIDQATYGYQSDVISVAANLQGLVDGQKLVVPAGVDAKNLFFGDPAPVAKEGKKLAFSYLLNNKSVSKEITAKEAFFTGLDEDFKKTAQLETSLLNGEYFWLSDYKLRIPAQGSVSFEAQGIEDLYVAFVGKPEKVFGTEKKLYEFVIGAEKNSKTILRKQSQKFKLTEVLTSKILAENKFQKYWISINNKGLILFGKGELGQNMLLAFQDAKILKNVQYVGFSCGLKPIRVRNISFAPEVNLDVAQTLGDYEKKLVTTKVSKTIKIYAQFNYFFLIDGSQVIVRDEAGKQSPVGSKDKTVDTFSIKVDSKGLPIVELQYKDQTEEKKALSAVASVVNSAAQAVGGIEGTATQAVGAGLAVAGAAIQAGVDAAYSGPTDIRTAEYQKEVGKVFTSDKVKENGKRIEFYLEEQLPRIKPITEAGFEMMINILRNVFLLIVNVDLASDARKDAIKTALSSMFKVYKNYPVDLYNNFISTLLKAYNNPFLYKPKDEEDEDAKEWIWKYINAMAQDMFEQNNEVEIPELYGNYLWFKQKLETEGNGAIRFKAQAPKDIFVVFSSEMGPIKDRAESIPLYELIIGRERNKSIAFRLSNKGYLPSNAIKYAKDAKDAMPSNYEYKEYWYSIKTAISKEGKKVTQLQMGTGEFKKENVILSWTDNVPYKNIKNIGIGSWATSYNIKDIEISQKPLGEAGVKWVPVCAKQGSTSRAIQEQSGAVVVSDELSKMEAERKALEAEITALQRK